MSWATATVAAEAVKPGARTIVILTAPKCSKFDREQCRGTRRAWCVSAPAPRVCGFRAAVLLTPVESGRRDAAPHPHDDGSANCPGGHVDPIDIVERLDRESAQESVGDETAPCSNGRQLREVASDDEGRHFEDIEHCLVSGNLCGRLGWLSRLRPADELLFDGVEGCASGWFWTLCSGWARRVRRGWLHWRRVAEADGPKARSGGWHRVLRLPSRRGRGATGVRPRSVRADERRLGSCAWRQRGAVLVVHGVARRCAVRSDQLTTDGGQSFPAGCRVTDFDFWCGLWVHGPHGGQTRRTQLFGNSRQGLTAGRCESRFDFRWGVLLGSASCGLGMPGSTPYRPLRVAPSASFLSQTDPTMQPSIARSRGNHKGSSHPARYGARQTCTDTSA